MALTDYLLKMGLEPDEGFLQGALKQLTQSVMELEAVELLAQTENDILTYMVFPAELWTSIYSTNLLERLNKEVKRRTNGVGVFPDGGSVTRQVEAVLLEIADECQVGRRYFPGLRLGQAALRQWPG